MSFVLVQIRPLGKRPLPWLILRSDSCQPHETNSVPEALRWLTINGGRTGDSPHFVVVHNKHDRPNEAFAVKNGVWRNLNLIVKHPKPGDWPYLYAPTASEEGHRDSRQPVPPDASAHPDDPYDLEPDVNSR